MNLPKAEPILPCWRMRMSTGLLALLRRGSLAIAAAGACGLLSAMLCAALLWLAPATPLRAADDTTIRPFHIQVPDEALADLHQRLAATRWPDKELVLDQTQGVQLATMQALVRYWQTDYDWRKAEAKLNALPLFVTTIDGVDIQFIHVRAKQANALPIIITHGWPGSIIEQLKIIEPLTDPTAYGGRAEDAFDVVIPSLPGYGFSGKPQVTGWNPDHIAGAWVVLMRRLGYTRFVAQGGDLGAVVSETMAQQAPPELLGIHTNMPATVPPNIAKALADGDPPPAGLSTTEKTAYAQLMDFYTKHTGYSTEMRTRPQTIGYSLADSPAGLAAWMIDHDPRSYAHIAQLFAGHPFGAITRDDLLDNITLYWLTNSGTSSSRSYWENHHGSPFNAIAIAIPVAVSVFPEEIYQAPRSWGERNFHKLIYWHEVDKGGHFAAWEQPELFVAEVRAAFRPLR